MQNLEQLKSGELLGTKTLKLSCELKAFPSEIFVLADTLEQLDLSGNHLSELPDNFDRLQNLKILFLSENNFTKFPSVLSKCKNLDIIGFKANQISKIDENSFPKDLRWLILTNNHLPHIPASIGKCHKLQKLMLAGNKLTSLPIELANCKNLELLRISANQISEMPTWLFSLPKLSWVALAGNPYFTQNKEYPIPAINEIDWNFLTIKDKLGEGASGTIHKAELLEMEIQTVAVKIFKGEITSDGFPRDEMLTSIRAGNHPNLVKVLGKFSNHPENNQGLVLELIPENFINLGNPPSFETCTRDTFKDELSFSLKEILRIMIGISHAVEHLHSQGILHGDLYAHNTLVEMREFQILFGDFGAASIYEKDSEFSNELTRIEARAFGCLMEDLLERVNPNEKNAKAYQALTALQLECMQSKVLARPNFRQISKRLSEIILIDL